MEFEYHLQIAEDRVYMVEAEGEMVRIGKEREFASFVVHLLNEEQVDPCQVKEVVHNLQMERYVLA